jgi:hypothetical protein
MTYAAHHSTYAGHHSDFASCRKAATTSDAVANKAGVLRRIFDSIFESRQKQADRDIAAFVAQRGGRITDELEREITRRLMTSNWGARG